MNISFVLPHDSANWLSTGVSEAYYVSRSPAFEHRYAKIFTGKGHKVSVLYLSSSHGSVARAQHEYGHSVIRIPVKGLRYIRQFVGALHVLGIPELMNADVIHFYNYYSRFCNACIPLLRALGKKIVAQAQTSMNIYDLFLDMKTLITVKSASMLLPINRTEHLRLLYRYKVPPRKIKLTHNGVDVKFFKPMDTNDCKRRLGIDGPHLLFVGRHIHEKGVDIAVKAYLRLVKDLPELALTMIGEGNMKPYCQDLAKNHNVNFMGFVQNDMLPVYYNSADIVMVPSRLETGNLIVPIEASACGVPIIGSNAEGVTASVSDNVNGLIVNPTEEEFSEAVRKVLNEKKLRLNLSKSGRHYAEETFSTDRVYRDLIEAYSTVINQ
ncbi:MAG: glycosyltransferase family 4 protein [Nitrososphaerales archaeon]